MPLVTTTISPGELVPKNSSRKSLIFQNEDGTNSVYIKRERSEATTVSSTDHDHRIGPGGMFALNNVNDGGEAIRGRWTAISSAGSPIVSWFETEDIVR